MKTIKSFDLHPDTLHHVLGLGVKKTYKRGHLFMDNHLSANVLYFVQKGAMRNYFYTEGLELTYWITVEGEFSCTVDFFTGVSGDSFLQALEPLEVIEVKRELLHLAYRNDPALEHFGRLLAEHHLGILERNYLLISEKSARKLYHLFLEWYPYLDGRVSLKYIASLLKLDQATLSRVRGKSAASNSA